MRRDSNPQGCGAEETRSVFQRSTQGAERRSGARPPAGGRGIPPSHINNGLSVSQPALGDVPKVPALKERHQVPAHPPSKDRRPKPERTKSALHLENISPVPKSEPSSTKWRVAPAGRALSLSRVPHAKKATKCGLRLAQDCRAGNLISGPSGRGPHPYDYSVMFGSASTSNGEISPRSNLRRATSAIMAALSVQAERGGTVTRIP